MNSSATNKGWMFLIFMIGSSGAAYSQKISPELKKELWKTIKPGAVKSEIPYEPPISSPAASPLTASPKNGKYPLSIYNMAETRHDVMYYYYKSRFGSLDEVFVEEYLRTHVVNAALPKKFVVAQKPGAGLTFSFNISGGGRRQISEKDCQLIKTLYGIDVEEGVLEVASAPSNY